MSAKADHFHEFVDAVGEDDIRCDSCDSVLTQIFAEVIHTDSSGMFAMWRGHCVKCDKEMWSKKVRGM